MTHTGQLYVVAYVCDAHSDNHYIECEIATRDDKGIWRTNGGHRLEPYWSQEISIAVPPIPDGWVDHLRALADQAAVQYLRERRAKGSPSLDLDLLFGSKPKFDGPRTRR